MSNSTGICHGCGEVLPPMKSQGNPRKWCSEACRVKAYRANKAGYKRHAAEMARARAVKAEQQKPPKPKCENCGAEMLRRVGVRFCSKRDCRNAANKARVQGSGECSSQGCSKNAVAYGMCGTHYARTWHEQNPEKSRRVRASARHRRRALEAKAFVEDIDFNLVLERDHWGCGICGEPIPRTAKFPDVMSPSLDHVIPLSRGGMHEYGNVQAAHYGCNAAKRDRVDDAEVIRT